MARLIVEDGPDEGLVFPVHHSSTVIGRGSDCLVRLGDRQVSREHARLFKTSNGFKLEDLGSRNGLFLNGHKIDSQMAVGSGDVIRLGATEMLLEFDEVELAEAQEDSARVKLNSFDSESDSKSSIIWDVTPVANFATVSRDLLRDPLHRLRMIYSLSEILRTELSAQELLSRMMDVMWATAQPDRAVIFLASETDKSLNPAVVRSLDESNDQIIISRSIMHRCFNERIAILMEDSPSDERFSEQHSVQAGKIRSAICAPLLAAGNALGVVYVDLQFKVGNMSPSYDRDDLDLIAGIALQASMALHCVQLLRLMRQNQRLEKELEIAREIQTNLLPREFPKVAGLEFAAMCIPARHVGGDYYDFLQMPDGKLCIVIGDASGKGIPAAILINMARTGIRGQARLPEHDSAVEMAIAVNAAICKDGSIGDLVTMLIAIYCPENGQLRYCNAGHVPGIIKRADGSLYLLSTGGPLMGVDVDLPYEEGVSDFKPGDLLVLYTDGLNEMINAEGEMYGTDRLEILVRDSKADSPEALKNEIYGDVALFRGGAEQPDDLTLVVVKAGE